jgi:Zn-dependent protease
VLDLSSAAQTRTCRSCGTELAAAALACPRCSTLVHRERLQELAALAAAADAAGDPAAARAHWSEARSLVPAGTQQHRQIDARMASLTEEPGSTPPSSPGGRHRSWQGQAIGAAIAIGLLFAGKLKFLLLGLSKLSTVTSMFGFVAVYWSIHGWPLAAGLAGSIYVHEMGHVAMLRRLGIQAGAPLFIPGVGALVMLREPVTDPVTNARIGLAGPVWGLGAAVAAWVLYMVTGAGIWLAIAELTGFINLFNLLPVWQLDGARGFHALSRLERWLVVAAIGAALLLTGVRLLWIIAAVAAYRAIRHEAGPGHTPTLVTFAGLVLALAWFARAVR